MKQVFVSCLIGLGLLLPSSAAWAQVITIGGSVAGRPLAITGKTVVPFEQLPPNVKQVIRSQAGPGVVAYVARGLYSGTGYSVTFAQTGGIRTLQFTSNGSLLSGDGGLITSPLINARTFSFEQLPRALQDAVMAQAAGGAVTSVMRGTYRAPVYDALVQPPGSSPQHVVVTPSGGLLQGSTINEAAGAAAPVGGTPVNAAAVSGTLSFQDLGWSVQKPMLDRSGYAHIETVQQMILPDGRIAYRGFYTRDNQQYEVTVAQDGTVIGEGLVGASVQQ
jgi:hypothetical protein